MKASWPYQQAHIGQRVAITVALVDAAYFDGDRRQVLDRRGVVAIVAAC